MQESGAAPAPFLVFPTESAVLDGSSVTFRWDPVATATGYRLEVSDQQDFSSLTVEEEVGTATWHTVEGAFALNRTLYYWRVVAHRADGEHLGDIVESFISTTAADAAEGHLRPSRAEKLGPLAEMITGGSEDLLYLHSREVGSDSGPIDLQAADTESFYSGEEVVGVEHEGLEFGQIWKVIYVVIGVVLAVIVALFFWTRIEIDSARVERAAESVPAQLRNLEAEATLELTSYGVVDAENGLYRIPIDRAMELLVDESLAEQGVSNP